MFGLYYIGLRCSSFQKYLYLKFFRFREYRTQTQLVIGEQRDLRSTRHPIFNVRHTLNTPPSSHMTSRVFNLY